MAGPNLPFAECLAFRCTKAETVLRAAMARLLDAGKSQPSLDDCSAELAIAEAATEAREDAALLLQAAQETHANLQLLEQAAWETYWNCESP